MFQRLQKLAEQSGLTYRECNMNHVQISGGVALVNVYRGKNGFSMHVQGMSRGVKNVSADRVIEAARDFKPARQTAERRRSYRAQRLRKWNQQSAGGGKPCCHWCKAPFESFEDTTADHVIAITRGGSNGDDNIVLACETCNGRRKNNVSNDELQTVNVK
jgi:5-methylcytosine-specific restriction endonuclease McrA